MKIECFQNMLPLIFKTESVLNPLLSSPPSSQLHVLVCSQMLTSPCQTEIRGGRCSPAEATPGRDAAEQSRPVLPGWGCLAAAALLPPGPACPAPSPLPLHQPLPPPLESLRGHPVIRCPSDVFTFFLTADTSGAHIQVIPVPLDTFHKIISAVVMAIFLPPVIFKLHDRNSWS